MKYHLALLSFLLLWSCGQQAKQNNVATSTETKISVTPSMVHQTSGGDNTAAKLFDGDIGTAWFPGWTKSNYPQRCIIDFGKKIWPSKIRYYDGAGQPQMNIYCTNDTTIEARFNELRFTRTLGSYLKWEEIPIMPQTEDTKYLSFRYMIVVIDEAQGEKQLREIEIYTNDGGNTNTDTITTVPPITHIISGASEKVNLCGFHWVPLDKLRPFKYQRIFVATNWIWQKGGLYVEPMFQAGSPSVPGFDTYLAAAKAQGMEIMPCINQTPAWYRQGWFNGALSKAQKPETPEQYSSKISLRIQAINGKSQSAAAASGDLGDDYPPVKPGLDRENPMSYVDFAGFWGQFIMRYGSVKHDISKLRVDKTPRWSGDIPNQPKTGLSLVKFVEVWNEPDKWWKRGGSEDGIYMKPQEYAAMLSACYDSIKAADPKVQVVMSGITGFDMEYLLGMATWFKAKGMPFKADVINVHHYSNRGNELGRWPPTWYEAGSVCPESDKDFVGIAPIVKFAKDIGKQIWVTEFGSDTRAPSWMFAAPVGGFSSEELQAQWLVRTYLEYMRLGVDNMFMFNAINEPGEANGGLYLNSGLMYGQNAPAPFSLKPSYLSVTKLIADLNGTAYLADLSTGAVRILCFKDSQKTRFVYWSPTMSGQTTPFKIHDCSLTATEWPQYFDIK